MDGRFEVDGTRYVTIQKGQYGAYLNGVVTCGSIWMCPVCAAKIASGRAAEVQTVVDQHLASGGRVVFLTLTQGHKGWHDPEPLRKSVSGRWRKMVSGKAWKSFQADTGYVGNVRALEPTHGKNGWHPHLHILLFFDASIPEDQLAWHVAKLTCRWVDVSRNEGFDCEFVAQSFSFCRSAQAAGEYITKWGVGAELTHGHMKKAGRGGRSPWQILADYEETGFPPDGRLFQQFAIAFKGARQLTWGGKIRKLYIELEQDDEVLAASPEPEAQTICALSEIAFDQIKANRLEGVVLEAAEAGGFLGVMAVLAQHGIASAGLRNSDWLKQQIPDLGWGLHGPPKSGMPCCTVNTSSH